MLLKDFGLLLLDLSHFLLSFQLGHFLALCLILGLFLLTEVIHEYPDDDNRILRIIIPQNLSLIDPHYHLLQPLIASFREDDDE